MPVAVKLAAEPIADEALRGLLTPVVERMGWPIRYWPIEMIRDHVRHAARAQEHPPGAQILIVRGIDAADLLRRHAEIPPELSLVAICDVPEFPKWATRPEVADVLLREIRPEAMAVALARASLHAARRRELAELSNRTLIQGRQLKRLNEIGVALSTEHDLDRLLERIVASARELTGADAGSLYLVDRDEEGESLGTLHFRVAQNDTLKLDFSAFHMPIDRASIAGYVALEGDILNIPDVYELPEEVEYCFNRSFDEQTGYRSQSMLVVPMKNHRNQIIGVLQLINKKRHPHVLLTDPETVAAEVEAFSKQDEELVVSIASQAAVAIENAQLYEDIQRQFESFIYASVQAIEARDPTTRGHSERVAVLTVGLAEAVNRVSTGPLGPIRFSNEQLREIHYASLLHDFGKIGVREHVLVKAKKLFPFELKHIEDRYRIIRKTLQLKVAREVIRAFEKGPKRKALELKERLERELAYELAQLDHYLEVIRAANEPSILPEASREELDQLRELVIEDPDGDPLPLLLPDEYHDLSIPKGSLNEDERREIESHVTHTYRFLQLIPWTRELRGVPEIAYGHHEKLDGSGYPRGVRGEEIPIQTRMMTISDIFDALTATDRPYKRAVPWPRALEILQMEVDEGKLDAELFRVFVAAEIYRRVPAGQEAA